MHEKSYISSYWKSPLTPPINQWINTVSEAQSMEDLTLSLRNQEEHFRKTWFYWPSIKTSYCKTLTGSGIGDPLSPFPPMPSYSLFFVFAVFKKKKIFFSWVFYLFAPK